jgi:MFS family permease
MRAITLGQCVGVFGELLFNNGVMLLYMTALGLSSERIIFYLSLPWLLLSIFGIPAAFLNDHYGKKKMGYLGQALFLVCMGLLILAGFVRSPWDEICLAVGIVVFGIGSALFVGGFFALMSPIVPEETRGRFLGNYRFAWQTVVVVLTGACTLFLSNRSPLSAFQLVLGIACVGLVIRMAVFYRKIPELKNERRSTHGLRKIFMEALRAEGYLPFCSYVFLLTLFTAIAPMIFALIECCVLKYGDGQVVWLANTTMVGGVAGYLFGGFGVDRWGTKNVFLGSHFIFGAVIFMFLLRAGQPLPIFLYLGIVHLLYGIVAATSITAISAEMLALIPADNKSVSISICTTLQLAGNALAGMLGAWILDMGLLKDSWQLFGNQLSQYDAILLVCGLMVVLLVVTLGLVPSVIRKEKPLHL